MMSADIPELKEKLRAIQLESELFWDKPQKPRFHKFAFFTSLVCLAIVIALAGEEIDVALVLLLAVFPGYSLLQYFQSKQQYEQFTRARELILYYKKLSEKTAGIS